MWYGSFTISTPFLHVITFLVYIQYNSSVSRTYFLRWRPFSQMEWKQYDYCKRKNVIMSSRGDVEFSTVVFFQLHTYDRFMNPLPVQCSSLLVPLICLAQYCITYFISLVYSTVVLVLQVKCEARGDSQDVTLYHYEGKFCLPNILYLCDPHTWREIQIVCKKVIESCCSKRALVKCSYPSGTVWCNSGGAI